MHDGNHTIGRLRESQYDTQKFRNLSHVIEIIRKNEKAKFALSAPLLGLLAACGGSGPRNDGETDSNDSNNVLVSGRVVDGYIANALVFRDANGNNRFDLGEFSALTNEVGEFSDLTGSDNHQIVVDTNSGGAYDTLTGFPLLMTMGAPGNYEVITPLTSLVLGLQQDGMSQAAAETAVKQVFNLSSTFEFASYDPFLTINNSVRLHRIAKWLSNTR